MSETTKEVTERYFEEKAKEELNLQDLHLKNPQVMRYREICRYNSYTDSRIIKYNIDSEDIQHRICYFKLEKIIKNIIKTGDKVDNLFYKNIPKSIQKIDSISLNHHDGSIVLDDYPNFVLYTSNWNLNDARSCRNENISRDIKLANHLVMNKYPMLKGHMEEPKSDNYGHKVTYSISLSNIEEKVSFRFNNNNGIDSDLEKLVEIVGGSPEFIPDTELYVVPSWHVSRSSIAVDKTGLWSLVTEKDAINNYQSFFTTLKNKYF